MSRIYTVVFQGTVTNAGGDVDYLSIQPADDKPVKLRGMKIGQISEVGDTAEEGLRISVMRLAATVTIGSGGSAATPAPMDSADTAAGCTTRVNDTTVSTTSGSTTTIEELAWNNRNSPFETWWPDPAFSPKVKQGEALIIRQQTTLADDMTACFTFYLEEE